MSLDVPFLTSRDEFRLFAHLHGQGQAGQVRFNEFFLRPEQLVPSFALSGRTQIRLIAPPSSLDVPFFNSFVPIDMAQCLFFPHQVMTCAERKFRHLVPTFLVLTLSPEFPGVVPT